MTKPFSILTVMAILLSGIAGAAAQETALPTYEFAGLPITPHQMAVLGLSGQIQERTATPTLARDGMPASPHQLVVLGRNSAEAPTEISQASPVTRAQ